MGAIDTKQWNLCSDYQIGSYELAIRQAHYGGASAVEWLRPVKSRY
jgi:hypothetical protein